MWTDEIEEQFFFSMVEDRPSLMIPVDNDNMNYVELVD